MKILHIEVCVKVLMLFLAVDENQCNSTQDTYDKSCDVRRC